MTDLLCPLCKTMLINTKDRLGYVNLDCPTLFKWDIDHGTTINYHYRLEIIINTVEHFYIPPYYISNYNFTKKSRVYKLYENHIILDQLGYEHTGNYLKLVTQVPLIHPDTESKMMERVNLLTKFL